jgi:hypothetical protein
MNRTTARPLREATTILAHLALLAATPLALWSLAGDPIPHHLPTRMVIQETWNGLRLQPSEIIDYLPALLADLLWIIWAWYAAWFLLALLADLLRLPAKILPRLTPKTAISALTATTTLINPVSPTTAVHTTVHPATPELPDAFDGHLRPAATTTTSLASPPTTPATVTTFSTPTTIANSPVTHHVVPGNNLWDLAATYYGDGEAWHLIYTANAGRPQSDGHTLSDPDLIQPGWNLTVPALAHPGTVSTPGTNPDATTPAPPAATRPTTHAPGSATPTPTAPATVPHTAPAHPVAGRRSPPPTAPTPADRPHTVGFTLPEQAGYTGITLIAATAAAVAVLRTRNRRRHHSADAGIPPLAVRLAAVHAAAESAHAYGHDPHDQPPPPYLRPRPGSAILGTDGDHQHETDLDTAMRTTGVLALSGPGALHAARAMALSILAATPPDAEAPHHILLTDQHLADQLFTPTTPRTVDRFEIAPSPEAAVARYQRRTRPAHSHADGMSPSTATPVTLLQHTNAALCDEILAAHAAAPGRLDAILIGEPHANADRATCLTVQIDGTILNATGPDAELLADTRVHTLTRQAATEIYHTLTGTRADPPPATPPAPNRSQPQAAHDPPRPDPSPDPPSTSTVTRRPTDVIEPDDLRRPPPTSHPAPRAPADPAHPDTSAPATPTAAPTRPLLLRVLGELDVVGPTSQAIALPAGQGAALLALLALHPDGLTVTEIHNLERPGTPYTPQARTAQYTAISRTRTLLRTALPASPGPGSDVIGLDKATGRYRLNPDAITTDLAHAEHLTQMANTADDPDQRLGLLVQAAALYRGELAAHLDATRRDWLATARYTILTKALALHLAIVRHAADTHPDTAAEHLRHATTLAAEDEVTVSTLLHLCRQLHRPDLAHEVYHQHTAALRATHDTPSQQIEDLIRTATSTPATAAR